MLILQTQMMYAVTFNGFDFKLALKIASNLYRALPNHSCMHNTTSQNFKPGN